ncbi:hypothetical protein [Nitrobacter sp.]|uniref:hypothetical protein n=1 Tax=Nitrobacter sp. TaxID=29420 RepID=UPI00399D57D4
MAVSRQRPLAVVGRFLPLGNLSHASWCAHSHEPFYLILLDDLDARLDPKLASPHFDAFMIPKRAEQRFMLIESLALAVIRQEGLSARYPES